MPNRRITIQSRRISRPAMREYSLLFVGKGIDLPMTVTTKVIAKREATQSWA